MKEESLLLLSDLQKLINQVVLIDYTIIILGGDLMDLLLQKDLPHQQYAVDAVSKVFENVAVGVPSFYYMNPLVNIKDSNIESNITELQKSVDNAECSYLPAKDYLHIDIKMETGTGKTFVYTKTIFELHQRYGLNKFVIAVP